MVVVSKNKKNTKNKFFLSKKIDCFKKHIPKEKITKINQIFKKVLDQNYPDDVNYNTILSISREVISKLETYAKKKNISCNAILGGSTAKRTYVKKQHDLDIFFRFDKKMSEEEIAKVLEKIVSNVFDDFEKLHGSRDYFRITYNNYKIEIVPVLNITDISKARNTTDYSPFHVGWLLDNINKLDCDIDLRKEIILAKSFFKANRLYGAESYLQAFSGHVLDILVTYYEGFLNLLYNVSNTWNDGIIIDVNNFYDTKEQVLLTLSQSKTNCPLVLIDPIQKTRNAANALSKKNFNKLIKLSKKFIANPSSDFFIKKTLPEILKQKQYVKLHLLCKKGKKDIVGSSIKKQIENIISEMKKLDFIISDNYFDLKNSLSCDVFLVYKNTTLSKEKEIIGPPISLKERVLQFKNKYSKTYVKNNRVCCIVSRNITDFHVALKKVISEIEFEKYVKKIEIKE